MANANDAYAEALTPFSIPMSSRNNSAPQSLADPSAISAASKPKPINHKGITDFPNKAIFAEVSSSPLWPSKFGGNNL